MSNKCDFIVSNTIEVGDSFGHVIKNDLHKRQGRYTYLYPSNTRSELSLGIGVKIETYSFMTDKTTDKEDYFNG